VGFNTALGFYLIFWGFGMAIFLVCSVKTNVAFVAVFALLVTGLFILAASYFEVAAGNFARAGTLAKVRTPLCVRGDGD
jgi:uncharacterized protein